MELSSQQEKYTAGRFYKVIRKREFNSMAFVLFQSQCQTRTHHMFKHPGISTLELLTLSLQCEGERKDFNGGSQKQNTFINEVSSKTGQIFVANLQTDKLVHCMICFTPCMFAILGEKRKKCHKWQMLPTHILSLLAPGHCDGSNFQ